MSYLMNTYARMDVAFVSGSGSYLTDEFGENYIDFGSGISVTNLGHNHPVISDIIANESKKVIHTSNLFRNPYQESLAKLISDKTFNGKMFFCNSGAEANEGAIKLARAYGNIKHSGARYKILSLYNAFHGRTYATLSATAQEKIQHNFTPIAAYNIYAPINDIEAIKKAIALNDVTGIIIEIYQGESGLLAADKTYIKELRKLCTDNDIILIFDEVQTGYGRTGKFFAYQQTGIEPDILTMAKAIANGLPMAALIAKDFVAECFTPGSHGTTFGGGQLLSKVAYKVAEIISDQKFLDDVVKKGELLKSIIKTALTDKVKVKGEGLLLGVETKFDPKDVMKVALKNKLIVLPAGCNTIRVYPPLNITEDDLKLGAERLIKSIIELYEKKI